MSRARRRSTFLPASVRRAPVLPRGGLPQLSNRIMKNEKAQLVCDQRIANRFGRRGGSQDLRRDWLLGRHGEGFYFAARRSSRVRGGGYRRRQFARRRRVRRVRDLQRASPLRRQSYFAR